MDNTFFSFILKENIPWEVSKDCDVTLEDFNLVYFGILRVVDKTVSVFFLSLSVFISVPLFPYLPSFLSPPIPSVITSQVFPPIIPFSLRPLSSGRPNVLNNEVRLDSDACSHSHTHTHVHQGWVWLVFDPSLPAPHPRYTYLHTHTHQTPSKPQPNCYATMQT